MPCFRPILVAFSEILVSIAGLEYAFTKAPNNMRSLVMSVYLFTLAFAAALDAALACKSIGKNWFMILC